MAKDRYEVSHEFFEFFQALLPKRVNTHRFGGGRPRKSDRDCLNAVLYVLRTGCQWQALDKTKFCPHSTAHDRFQEWQRAGVFTKLFDAALKDYDELKGIDWSFLSLDGVMTKAPLGGEKNRPQSHRPREKGHQAQSAHGRGGHSSHRRRGSGQYA